MTDQYHNSKVINSKVSKIIIIITVKRHLQSK